MSKLTSAFALCCFGVLLCSSAVFSFADSQARIVRLSQVEGTVQVDRNTGLGFEKAFLNLPITQGTKLRTEKDGRAEIEFEDGSTLRITPSTEVEFSALALRDSGGRVTGLKIAEGTAYLDFKGAKDDELNLSFGREKLAMNKPTHLRVQMGDTDANLAVFKGKVEVEAPSGLVAVDKKRTATFDLSNSDKSTVAENLEADPYDTWDKQQAQYHSQYASANSYSPYGYGMSDLNYYGSYFNAPGYGLMWQPYFAGIGWNPFMDGAWFAGPGYGYMWVSAYPWGWMPYRYGTWIFLPGAGWAWQPGTAWTGWNRLPTVVNPPHQFTSPKPPSAGTQTVLVGRPPLGTALPASSTQTVLHNNAAGLGIARGSVSNLGRISREVNTNGSATATVHSSLVRGWGSGPSMGLSPNSGGTSMSSSAGASSSHTSSSHASSSHAGGGAHK
jgi:hypothetical protein